MKPIRSRRELAEARKILRDLRRQMAVFRTVYRQDKEALELATRGLRQLARETRRAILSCEQALAGQLPAVVGARNHDNGRLELPRLLRQLRQAAQLGQAELAERLGTQQATVSRWEREGYDRYSLRLLQRIAEALGWDLEVSFIRRKTKEAQ